MSYEIFSLHWENIDPRIPYYQKKVMDKHQMHIKQHCISGFDHGEWMDWVMNRTDHADVILFMDVDCIILNKDMGLKVINKAYDSVLIGNEQATNHLGEFVASRIFVAPSFMAVNRNTWKAMGKPSFRSTPFADVGQNLTDVWEQRGMPVQLLRATGCDVSKWDLPGRPQAYGIGTTFSDITYHLFESRDPANADRFVKKCEEILG